MATNPYAPPKAAVADIEPVGASVEPSVFPVSRAKLVVLGLATLGLYELHQPRRGARPRPERRFTVWLTGAWVLDALGLLQ